MTKWSCNNFGRSLRFMEEKTSKAPKKAQSTKMTKAPNQILTDQYLID